MSERHMSTVDDIKQCRTPQEALLLLAAAIDDLRAAKPAMDLWEQPLAWPPGVVPRGEMAALIESELLPDYRTQIAEVEAALATATGEDAQALRAQLNLLRDAAGEKVYDTVGGIREATPDGKRVTAEGDDVVIPPASPERQDARLKWAIDWDLHEFLTLLNAEQARANFAKGGPMWLYEGNRDAIMQMPYEARMFLVQDVALDSEAQAQELGRDILKSPTSTDQQITTQAILDGAVGGRG